MAQIVFHGTGARRRQSISRRGVLPKPDSYVFASPKRTVAEVFATARAEQEDDWGLVLAFKAGPGWEKDPDFPDSVRCTDMIKPRDIVSMEVLDPEKEIAAYERLQGLVKLFNIRIIAIK